jgi:hypothetical protein
MSEVELLMVAPTQAILDGFKEPHFVLRDEEPPSPRRSSAGSAEEAATAPKLTRSLSIAQRLKVGHQKWGATATRNGGKVGHRSEGVLLIGCPVKRTR